MLTTPYTDLEKDGYEIFLDEHGFIKDMAIFDTVPDILHLDDDNFYIEYWVDDDKTASIEISNLNSYYTFDKDPFIYKVYDGDSYEVYEIEKNLDPLPTMEYEGCTYQIYPDNTLAFYSLDDKTVSSVDIPEIIDGMEVTGIKMFAFDQCEITSVHLPETITYIEPFAFYQCEDLRNVNFPKGLKSIGGSGFCECTALGDLNIDCPDLKFSSFSFYHCLAKNITVNTRVVPKNVTSHFFKYKSLNFGKDVTEIGYNYLLDKNIEIPENVKVITWDVIPESYITIPEHIEILGAYRRASGNLYHSVSIGGDPVIPLIENKSMAEMFNTTIMGYYGTEAHNYAIAHNAEFIPLDDVVSGDANGDGKMNIADLVSLQNYLLKDSDISYGADVNKDDRIDVFDLAELRRQIIRNT